MDDLRTKRKAEYTSLTEKMKAEHKKKMKTVLREFHHALKAESNEHQQEMENITREFYEETKRMMKDTLEKQPKPELGVHEDQEEMKLKVPQCMYTNRKNEPCINAGFRLGETGKWKGKMMCKTHWPQTQPVCDIVGCNRRGCQKHNVPKSPPNMEKEQRMTDFMASIKGTVD